ncbi:MAG: cellulose biosynthesis cyclic di-GMP-binding regulatory protein BcsB [Pseudomonas sp.]|nr:cellulose biosynthesis cyclic di-GMP-binding regulatory protein BcsB [Pseudomonas sp.]MDP3847343.1 cellulose biosynthesis cyclic di-GMP-binding regulatory protein BcsB [Pseudomonas sp.]
MSLSYSPAKPKASLAKHAWVFFCAAVLAANSALVMAVEAVVEPPVAAPEVAAEGVAEAVVAPIEGRTASSTLKQLGMNYVMNLRGIEGSDSVNFDIRANEVVTSARLTLEYSYSPALLPDLSNINVLVNDEVVASLALPKETAGVLQKQVIEIPPHLITEFNRLSLQLIGHYTMQCEDPLHSSLWAKISNSSVLEIQVTQIALADDLAILPLPFFDRRDSKALELPFVFAGTLDNRALEAAGMISSWFGALASYRGANFPVSQNQLPATGNAIVFLRGTDPSVLAGLQLPAISGPTLLMVANPNDQYGKLLLVAGRDDAEIKLAALALVTGSKTLSGARVTVDRFDTLQARKPYDAPNWLPSDRPVKLGELATAKQLNVSGYNPGTITIPLRIAPDLFSWREAGMPLTLKYRYTPQPISTNSSLLISMNDKFIKSTNLPSIEHMGAGESLLAALAKDDSLVQELQLRLPVDAFPPESRLQFRYMYDYIKQGDCRDIIIDNMRGAIEPDSTIDLSGYDHFIALPDLGVFRNSGFPFTRLADLAETAVIMPDNLGPAEVTAYLAVMGRFGESTGYPATAVTVAAAAQVADLEDKDLLVFASGANQPLLKEWADYLPAGIDGQLHRFELSDLLFRLRSWIDSDASVNVRQARSNLAFSGSGDITYLTGFESPQESERSVVVIASGRPEGLADATAALVGGDAYDQPIQGSLAVVRGKKISALVAEQDYYVGSLGLFKYIQWMLSRHLWLLLLVTGLGCLLVTGLLYAGLRARAKQRLGD